MKKVEERYNKDTKIITICLSGKRAKAASKILKDIKGGNYGNSM